MRVLPSTHPLGKLEACPMRNWLILSNDTLGDTLLSLQLLSLAKKWRKFDEVTLVLPERYSGISELVDGLNVTEVVGGAGVADAKEFDEVLDLECAVNSSPELQDIGCNSGSWVHHHDAYMRTEPNRERFGDTS